MEDKSKAQNLELDFLVVDVFTAYNIIIRSRTLDKIKALWAPLCYNFGTNGMSVALENCMVDQPASARWRCSFSRSIPQRLCELLG